MKRILIAALALTLTSCAARQSSVTNLPAGVTQAQVQAWDAATANLNKIAVANSGLRQAVISMHGIIQADGTPLFPSGTAYVTTLETIGKIDQVENSAAVFLEGVPNNWGASTKTQIAAYMAQIVTLIQQLNSEGVTGIKSTSSQAQISQAISEIAGLVNIILAL